VPDVAVPGSKVYILAQNPGGNEVQGHRLIKRHYVGRGAYSDEYEQVQPQPLIGTTGRDFTTRFLPLSGLKRDEVSLGNSIRCRPAFKEHADGLPPITATMKFDTSTADIVKALRYCRETHMHIPSSVRVVMTMGAYAMFAMTGISRDEDEYHKRQSALESWRGYAVAMSDYNVIKTVDTTQYHALADGNNDKMVFMTMHIAALYYGENTKFTHAVLQDFHKLGRLLRGEWPVPLSQWSTVAPVQWPRYAAFDTEYVPQDNTLLRWSLCDTHGNVYCIEADAQHTQIPVEDGSTVLIQNALADIEHLSTLVDFSKISVEDLMLAHSVLWSGEPHSLNYLNSIYGELNRYKHLSGTQPQQYSAADAYEPMRMWRTYFIPEFKRDQQSWQVYKRYRLPLIHIIDKAQRSGAKLDSERLRDLQILLQERLAKYRRQAQELMSDAAFNIGGSKQLKEALYGR
jgi:uracil-DNA glycosylase